MGGTRNAMRGLSLKGVCALGLSSSSCRLMRASGVASKLSRLASWPGGVSERNRRALVTLADGTSMKVLRTKPEMGWLATSEITSSCWVSESCKSAGSSFAFGIRGTASSSCSAKLAGQTATFGSSQEVSAPAATAASSSWKLRLGLGLVAGVPAQLVGVDAALVLCDAKDGLDGLWAEPRLRRPL